MRVGDGSLTAMPTPAGDTYVGTVPAPARAAVGADNWAGMDNDGKPVPIGVEGYGETDAGVLKYRGGREDWKGGGDSDGGTSGTQSFDFTALAKGRATVRLLYCPMSTCHGPDDTATPYPTGTAPAPAHATATAAPSPTPGSTVSPSLSP
ncbi:hypothetical protein ABB07_21585 [Streptomyces incarnatus]|uniref:Lipoprotein n=1 Tax=Streptomyces incarnatus TaxID=665007 RepID=A0ABM5TND1_9ACTN|nr:hypothetical protein [Streptomyces incarnatus]AKJ12525.1 hypothetical protein ABB07_21585 [Streptomyces incarnatus]